MIKNMLFLMGLGIGICISACDHKGNIIRNHLANVLDNYSNKIQDKYLKNSPLEEENKKAILEKYLQDYLEKGETKVWDLPFKTFYDEAARAASLGKWPLFENQASLIEEKRKELKALLDEVSPHYLLVLGYMICSAKKMFGTLMDEEAFHSYSYSHKANIMAYDFTQMIDNALKIPLKMLC